MVSLRNFEQMVVFWRVLRVQKLFKTFKVKSLLLWVIEKETVTQITVVDHFLWRETAELHYFKDLVKVVLAREDWCFDEKFDGSATERPHIDALIISR